MVVKVLDSPLRLLRYIQLVFGLSLHARDTHDVTPQASLTELLAFCLCSAQARSYPINTLLPILPEICSDRDQVHSHHHQGRAHLCDGSPEGALEKGNFRNSLRPVDIPDQHGSYEMPLVP